jgi:formate dehydrogenase subunit delta
MEIGNLIRMANRIGQFFEAMPDRQEAGEGVANHIHKFWEPRMRTQLLDFLAGQPDGEAGQETLHPLVREAVQQNRDRLTPAGRKPD